MCSRRVKIASIYSFVNRLEEKGYVTWRVADPTPERGNSVIVQGITPTGEDVS